MMHAFDRVCEISALLDEDQFELFSILLENYTCIEYDYYVPGMQNALAKMTPSPQDDHIYRVCPILSPKDQDKSKSGHHLVYTFRHVTWKRSTKFSKFPIQDYISVGKLKKSDKPTSPYTTIFIDDFIGSGGTVEKFLNDYGKDNKSPLETIVFLSIAAMEHGVTFIKSRGYDIFYDQVFLKGIRDCAEITDKTRAYALMDKIEAMAKVSKNMKYGYEKSEGLISLIRTPNNTFPIFWLGESSDGTKWPAPFPRY